LKPEKGKKERGGPPVGILLSLSCKERKKALPATKKS